MAVRWRFAHNAEQRLPDGKLDTRAETGMLRAMRTVFSWVHLADLSDLAARVGGDCTSDLVLAALVQDVRRLVSRAATPNAIFVTGDVGESGRHYDDAVRFLEKLTQALSLSSEKVFVVPGNHDVDVTSGGLITRQLIHTWQTGGAHSFDDVLDDKDAREVLQRRLKHYLGFASNFASGQGLRLSWSYPIPSEPRAIRVIGLSTVLLWDSGAEGKLRIGQAQRELLETADDELVVLLTHHPLDADHLSADELSSIDLGRAVDVHLSSASYLRGDLFSPTNHRLVIGAGGRVGSSPYWSYHLAAMMQADDGRLSLRIWPRRWSPEREGFHSGVTDELKRDPYYEDRRLPERRQSHEGPPTPKKWPSAQHIPYLERVCLENIGPLRSVDWDIAPQPGWNVMIGNNGSGKTTFLRALSYALVASSTHDHKTGKDEGDRLPFDIRRLLHREGASFELSQQVEPSGSSEMNQSYALTFADAELRQSYADRRALRGMFHAGFGPFRRFTGGDEGYEKEVVQFPRVFRHLSLFTERVAFYESVRWLKYLEFKAAKDHRERPLCEAVKKFVNNEHLFPAGVHLEEITPDDITFRDANGVSVRLEDLSDGFRSILSLSLELVRQLVAHYGRDRLFDPDSGVVVEPGIVLIDEVDAHLHPTWQREIGVRLRKLFPQVQFIVTTHSALVCQGAADGQGSIFRLPKPGSDEEGRLLEGIELARILYGNVLDAYGTEAFGAPQRSAEGEIKLARLTALNVTESQRPLSPEEEREQDELRAIFATSRC